MDLKNPIPENLQKLLNEKPAPVNSSGNPSSFEEPPWAQPRYLSAPFPGYTVFEAQPRMTNPEGNGSLGIMFMGEAPGEWEEAEGLPFRPHAQAGSVLQRAFNELGIQRSLALITNASWFRPPRNWLEDSPWQHEYVADGRLRNLELISRFRPQVIVALGEIAFQELTGMYEVGIEQGRGFIAPARKEYGSIPVIGTYHPSFIIRGAKRKSVETGAMTEKASGGGWSFYSVLKRDIALAMLVQKNPIPITNFQDPRFVRFGTRDHWDLYYRRALDNPNLPISYDFETPMSVAQTDESEFEKAMGNITQFQVALEPGEALVSSWDHSLYTPIKKLMELPNPKLDWNGRGFDRDILKNLGINLVGEYHDLMRMWSHWERDLPRGLQFATSYVSPQDGPWKHTFDQDLRSYGVRDVHEPQKIWEFLRKNMTGVKHPAGKDLLWGYQRQVYELHTKILDPLQELGIPVNEQRRAELRECLLNLEAKVNAEVNELVPEHLKPTKQKDGLKGVPKEILAELKPDLDIEAEYAAESEVSAGYAKKVTKKRIAEFYKELCQKKVSALPERHLVLDKIFVQRNFPITDKFGVVLGYERRWAELEDFNSNSSHQLLAYIEWKHKDEIQSLGPNPSKTALKNVKFKVPLDYKTKKPTTAKKELDRLGEKTGDPVIKRVIEYRELAKMRSTYVEGWAPGTDGRVHPFYDDNTGTSQLTAVRPAALTFPKHLKRKINFSAYIPLEKIRGCVHEWTEGSGGTYVCVKCEIPSKSYELGKLVRTMIEPRPGHRIIECVRPNTKIMTWDLRWVPIKDVKPGDALAGFDEQPTINPKRPGRSGRKLRQAQAVSTHLLLKPCIRITTDKGVLECSKDHLLVSRGKYKSKGYGWIAAQDMQVGMKVSFLTKPWEVREDREAAYLAGFLDGEGFMNGSCRCGFGQNRGLVSDHVCSLIRGSGYEVSVVSTRGPMESWYIKHPDAFSGLRFIGQIRPLRLLLRAQEKMEGLTTWGRNSEAATILSIEDIGIQEVIALETTTHTYIAEGFLSHNCDFKAFHVLTTGFEAKDEKYMRLARLDMHSFIAATQLLGLARSEELIVLPDKELMKVLKDFRKDPTPRYHGPGGIKVPFEFVRGKQAKPAILGYGFGMQPPRFYHENQEFLPSLDFAYTVFMGLDREFPICAAWRKNVVNFAYRQGGFLISQHGFIRRFNCCVDKFPVSDDYRPRPGETIRIAPDGMHWCFGPGDDAEAIIAFLPANDAFGMIKETMLRLEARGLTKKYNLIIPIHDALVFECPEEFVDECIREVTMEMQKPSDILILPNGQGLWCEVEASINKPGHSWAEMDEIKL